MTMKSILTRLSYIVLLWSGAGLGSWLFGVRVGVVGAFLGMFSGADLYRSMGNSRLRFLLMFTLGMIGMLFGFVYEYLVSTATLCSSAMKIGVFGIALGGVFTLLSSGLGLLFGAHRERAG